MNSQNRGGRAPNASRQRKSTNNRQATKSQTNGGFSQSNNNNNGYNYNNNNNSNRQNRRPRNNINTPLIKNTQMNGVGAAYSRAQVSQKPVITRQSVDSCHIKHRELIMNLTGSATFVAVQKAANPGIFATLPWLSIQAQGWEKYRFRSLRVCYYPRCGTSTPGSVMLSVDYDAADTSPVSEMIASVNYGTVEDAPWKDLCLSLDPKRLAGERFIRNSTLVANLDIKTYDVANLLICTTDGTAVNWGKVWIEYEVELINPQFPAGGPFGSATIQSDASSIFSTNFMGNNPSTTGSYHLSTGGNNTLTMSGLITGQEYGMTMSVVGTTITVAGSSTYVGLTLFTQGAAINAAETEAIIFFTFFATATTASFVVSLTLATITSSVAFITGFQSPNPNF
jgi:hypothetical protein